MVFFKCPIRKAEGEDIKYRITNITQIEPLLLIYNHLAQRLGLSCTPASLLNCAEILN